MCTADAYRNTLLSPTGLSTTECLSACSIDPKCIQVIPQLDAQCLRYDGVQGPVTKISKNSYMRMN
jgi:hypothetical protein